jgi:hypothetical protein
MFSGVRTTSHTVLHGGRSMRLGLIVTLILGTGLAARPAGAWAAPFQRGDVVASVTGGINDYAPDGTLKHNIDLGGSRGGELCFDPDGTHLIAPGTGLFDRSGNQLSSNWASIAGGECAVDGSGHVYVGASGGVDPGTGQPYGTINQYDLRGNLRSTYTVAAVGPYGSGAYAVGGLDLAPDECTIYYDTWGGSAVGRFNVCTRTQESSVPLVGRLADLRVLPNWDIALVFDGAAWLADPSGNQIQFWGPQVFQTTGTKYVTVDPDGGSMWVGSNGGSSSAAWRLDFQTGQTLTSWGVAGCASGGCGIYGIAAVAPPLIGEANVGRILDSDPSGTAEAFSTRAGSWGRLSRLHLWVESSSTATQVALGVYSDNGGHPDVRLGDATITDVRAGSWNQVQLPSSIPTTAGQRYWIAVLGTKGAGTIRFRDKGSGGGSSQTSAQHNLTALPLRWSPGSSWTSAPVSAYGS